MYENDMNIMHIDLECQASQFLVLKILKHTDIFEGTVLPTDRRSEFN